MAPISTVATRRGQFGHRFPALKRRAKVSRRSRGENQSRYFKSVLTSDAPWIIAGVFTVGVIIVVEANDQTVIAQQMLPAIEEVINLAVIGLFLPAGLCVAAFEYTGESRDCDAEDREQTD